MIALAATSISGRDVLYFTDSKRSLRQLAGGWVSDITTGYIGACGAGPLGAGSLNTPQALAMAPDGSVLAVDSSCGLRRLWANGTALTVVAHGGYQDGPAATALVQAPRGLTLDASGNVYLADTGNNRLRVLYSASSTVATLAGGNALLGACVYLDGPAASATLCAPVGIAVRAGGSELFFCEPSVHTVRRLAGGVVRTLAGSLSRAGGYSDGTGVAGALLASPTALLLSEPASTLYIATQPHIRTLSLSTGAVGTLVGAPWYGDLRAAPGSGDGPPLSARLNNPTSLAVRVSDGALLIGDAANCVIRALVCPGAAGASASPSTGAAPSPSLSPSPTPLPTQAPPLAPAAPWLLNSFAGCTLAHLAGSPLQSGGGGAVCRRPRHSHSHPGPTQAAGL